MKLKYHQATYELLTKQHIDIQPNIQNYTFYYDALIQGCGASDQYAEELAEGYRQIREHALAWTRLNLYQRPVVFSEDNVRQLDVLEKDYKIQFPASVREWFSLDIVPEIMSAPFPEFGFVPIHEFKPFSQMTERLVELKEIRDDLWYFLASEYIDQGGEDIAFKIDSGDDPSVYAEYGGRIVELSPAFSEFIYLHFWDWYGRYMFPYYFQIIFKPIPIEQIQRQFIELKGNRRIRFYDDHTRIRLLFGAAGVNNDLSTLLDSKRVAGGQFHTDSLEAMKELITRLWGQKPPFFDMHYADKETMALIEQLKATIM